MEQNGFSHVLTKRELLEFLNDEDIPDDALVVASGDNRGFYVGDVEYNYTDNKIEIME
nr:MAG TPA: hypothetical protein [Herelleviridae sp.]